ncbi:SufE family protein [Cellvibrio japonicus]
MLPVIDSDDFSAVSLTLLASAEGWQQQYKLIIDWGKAIPAKPTIRTPEHRIQGCELPLWLAHKQCNGVHYFALDADSNVIKGLASLVLAQVNGTSPVPHPAAALQQLGLEKHLTPSRNNGLKAIIARVEQLLAG